MQVRAVLLAAALVLAPLGARAADLVVWWEEGSNPREDQAVRETVAAFEQKTGDDVQLTFYPGTIRPGTIGELPNRTAAAVEAGHPPDFGEHEKPWGARWRPALTAGSIPAREHGEAALAGRTCGSRTPEHRPGSPAEGPAARAQPDGLAPPAGACRDELARAARD